MYLNKALIYGNLTRDPELRALPSGSKVATFSVATNRVYKDQNGVKQENTDFHNVVVFGKQAEIIHQYLRKGSPVFVEGRMQTRSWEDKKDGQKKYRTEIVVENFQFGPKPAGASGAPSGFSGNKPSSPAVSKDQKEEEIDYPDAEDEGIKVEEIPF
jgi:single-strand DNA-binding protein